MDIAQLFGRLDSEMQRVVLEMLQRLVAIQLSEKESNEKFEALKTRVVSTELNQ